jgi:hypothetical protein
MSVRNQSSGTHLRLGAGLIAGNEQHGGVHDRSAVEHRRHQNIVTGAVNERHVAATGTID